MPRAGPDGLLSDGRTGGQLFCVERHIAPHGAHWSDGRNQFAIDFDFQGAGVAGQKTEAAPRRNFLGISRAQQLGRHQLVGLHIAHLDPAVDHRPDNDLRRRRRWFGRGRRRWFGRSRRRWFGRGRCLGRRRGRWLRAQCCRGGTIRGRGRLAPGCLL